MELIACAREMVREGLVVGRVGNLSIRLEDLILVTPSRIPYERMRAADIVEVSETGERIAGPLIASRELPLHLAVYRERPDIGAIIHTHSPHATAWSFLDEPLMPRTEDNAYYSIGEVLTSRPAPSGSTELAETAAARLGDSSAVLLGRHGVLATGTDLREALEVAAAVEHQAQIALLLKGAVASPARNDRSDGREHQDRVATGATK